MFDDQNGIACGERGALSKTSNGGQNWTDVALPLAFFDPNSQDPKINEPGDLYRIHFFDAGNGIITADHGRVLTTTDGGQTWATKGLGYCAVDPNGDLELWSASFNGQEGWIVGGNGPNDGRSFYTTDGGVTWDFVAWVVPVDQPAFGDFMDLDTNEGLGWPTFYGVAAMGNGEAVAVSYASNVYEFKANDTGTLAVNRCGSLNPLQTNGSPAWFHEAPDTYTGSGLPPSGRPPLGSVFALDTTQRWLSGTFGVIQRWQDSIGEWVDVGSTPRVRFTHFDFVDEDVGVIVGQGHRILRTVDGGVTWDLKFIGTDNGQFMRRVALSRKPASGLGLAHGDAGFLHLTQDQGETWTAISSLATGLHGMAMAGETDHVYVGGQAGKVWRTILSGSTPLVWQIRDLPSTDHTVNDFAFVDEAVGYAVTSGMTLWHTSNGGSAWSEVSILTPPPSQILNAVATWGDGSKAVAVGTGGLVLVRNGARFQQVDLSALAGSAVLNDVTVQAAGSTLRIVIAGNDGLVLEFEGLIADALDPLNWSAPKSQSSAGPLLAVSFVGIDRGFALGPMSTLVEFR